jgi:prepilin-type N-terminal cleavage/methylation domain-containing protein
MRAVKTTPLASARSNRKPALRRGFTLIELLVVITIMVLLLGLAVLAFNSITGNRSTQAAANVLQSTLTRVQQEAVGLQTTRGVAVFIDPLTDRTTLLPVEQPVFKTWVPGTRYQACDPANPATIPDYVVFTDNNAPPVTHYYVCKTTATAGASPVGDANFDAVTPLVVDHRRSSDELIPLPAGIGVQVMYNVPAAGNTTRQNLEGYMSIGAILFDNNGRLMNDRYWIAVNGWLGSAAHLRSTAYYTPIMAADPLTLWGVEAIPLKSVPAICIYDRGAFKSAGFTDGDDFYTTNGNASNTYTPAETAEENWLDANAQPYLIGRYNGTLTKGE